MQNLRVILEGLLDITKAGGNSAGSRQLCGTRWVRHCTHLRRITTERFFVDGLRWVRARAFFVHQW